MKQTPSITGREIIQRYQGFLIDAYGVLVDGSGARPGARAFLEELLRSGKPWRVVTNDASRSPESCAARYQQLGLPIPSTSVLTSGGLLTEFLASRRPSERPAGLVLGPPDAHRYVANGGWSPVGPEAVDVERTEGLIVADDAGFDLRVGMNAALSLAYARRDLGADLLLVVPNPDLVYPSGPARFGFAAGALAQSLESALDLRFPGDPCNRFIRLGKPAPELFEAGLEAIGTRNAVMLGDQLTTDVAGALKVGIDAVWVSSGVGRLRDDLPSPTYQLDSFAT